MMSIVLDGDLSHIALFERLDQSSLPVSWPPACCPAKVPRQAAQTRPVRIRKYHSRPPSGSEAPAPQGTQQRRPQCLAPPSTEQCRPQWLSLGRHRKERLGRHRKERLWQWGRPSSAKAARSTRSICPFAQTMALSTHKACGLAARSCSHWSQPCGVKASSSAHESGMCYTSSGFCSRRGVCRQAVCLRRGCFAKAYGALLLRSHLDFSKANARAFLVFTWLLAAAMPDRSSPHASCPGARCG